MIPSDIRPDALAFLKVFNQTPLSRLEELSLDEARAWMAQVRASAPVMPHGLAEVRDLAFENSGHSVAMRLYDKRAKREPGAVIVYFHGGGFVFGDLDSHHALCLEVASQMDLPVVSVAYRLAPEHPFPAAPQDAEAAARWVGDHALDQLGRGVTSLVLAGDSSGGNLAAVTARALRDAPAAVPVIAQFLMYPCTGVEVDTPSKAAFARDLFLTKSGMDWFFQHYAPEVGDPRIDLHAFDQKGMPPTVLVTAEFDPLRDEGRAYAAALIKAGVATTYQEVLGDIHGCFSMCAVIPSSLQDLRKALEALKITIRRNLV